MQKRAAQRVAQRQAAVRVALNLARVEVKTVAPIGLGAVHRGIGTFGECVQICTIFGVNCDADRGRNGQLVPLHQHRRLGHLQQLGGNLRCPLGVGVRHEDDELVAAQARDRVLLSHDLTQSQGQLHQHRIPHAMAQRVVDGFEVV